MPFVYFETMNGQKLTLKINIFIKNNQELIIFLNQKYVHNAWKNSCRLKCI